MFGTAVGLATSIFSVSTRDFMYNNNIENYVRGENQVHISTQLLHSPHTHKREPAFVFISIELNRNVYVRYMRICM